MPSDISCAAIVLNYYLSLTMLFNFSLIYVFSLQLDHKLAKGRDPYNSLYPPIVFNTVSYVQQALNKYVDLFSPILPSPVECHLTHKPFPYDSSTHLFSSLQIQLYLLSVLLNCMQYGV